MPDKYQLIQGDTYRSRLQAVRDFAGVTAGDFGGYVGSRYNLSHDGDAWIADNASVIGNAQVMDNARVAGVAWVAGSAVIAGNARVFNRAEVCGTARIFDHARVGGQAKISGAAQIFGHARVFGQARVLDLARVYNNALVYGGAIIRGRAEIIAPITLIVRSDGATFTLLPTAAGPVMLSAECRFFTLDNARRFWLATRGGTKLGEETQTILDFFASVAINAAPIDDALAPSPAD